MHVLQLILCKDGKGMVGVRVAAINKGVFVCLVMKDSPAALAGLRFGDQLLQINGHVLAGYSMDQVHDLFKKSPVNGISVIVRDRCGLLLLFFHHHCVKCSLNAYHKMC